MRDKKLKKIIHTIVSKAKPEKIYLFGSRATGSAKQESDYDILVVQKTRLSNYERILSLRNLFKLKDFSLFSLDILVYTPSEIKKWENATASFIHHVLKTGKLVYER